MGEPALHSDIVKLNEELKEHQLLVGYTIFRALKENKNITSVKDFSDHLIIYYTFQILHKFHKTQTFLLSSLSLKKASLFQKKMR